MKEFTQEMVEKIRAASDSVKGTTNYFWYDMAWYFKGNNGKWVFGGYYIPSKTGTFRKYKDKLYIITEKGERYEVNDKVKELLGY